MAVTYRYEHLSAERKEFVKIGSDVNALVKTVKEIVDENRSVIICFVFTLYDKLLERCKDTVTFRHQLVIHFLGGTVKHIAVIIVALTYFAKIFFRIINGEFCAV